MAETYYQKLAHKVTPPEISREKLDNVARILEEELSGIVKLLNDAADSLDMEGLEETANRIKSALAERGMR